jgi:cytochrome P450 family 135
MGSGVRTIRRRPARERAGSPSPKQLPAGPRLPATLLTLAWVVRPTAVMDRCARRYGEAFTLRLAGRRLVFVADPEVVKTVLTAPPEIAPSGTNATPIAPLLGDNSLLVLTGPDHLRHRRLLLPQFHGRELEAHAALVEELAAAAVARWPDRARMRLHPRIQAITLEVILRVVFGVGAERLERTRAAILELLAEATRPTAFRRRRRRPGGRLGEQLERVHRLLDEEIAAHRGDPALDERSDVLSLMLRARDDEGRGMTDAELRDELVTLLIAGHETTATATAWALERLMRTPAAMERLVAEVEAGEEERYLEAVVHETLRLRPVLGVTVRQLQAPLEAGPLVLPQGARIALALWLTNHNPRVYDEPERFVPERFVGRKPDTYRWVPFGGGIRRCIGASFAQLEMKIVLRTVLREMRLEPVRRRGEHVKRRSATFVPSGGALARVTRRDHGGLDAGRA